MLLPTIKGKAVLLPSHSDAELDQPVIHYHLDPRYHKGDDPIIIPDDGEEIVFQEFPDIEAEPKEMNFGIAMYLQLLSMYEGRKLCGTRCPHRGIEVFHNGQCMGHGLRFDMESKVKGKLCDCYLLLPGSRNRGDNGVFTHIKIVEFMPKVTEVWLMYGDEFLAKNKVGPVYTKIKDTIKFSFTVNAKQVEPKSCGELQ